LYLGDIENISPSDIITDGMVTIDLCQDIRVSGNVLIPTIEEENFGAAGFNAMLSYRGKGIATIEEYVVPLPHGDPILKTVGWKIPGGACDQDVFRECATDKDCGPAGSCEYTAASVEVVLYDVAAKQLIEPGQRCPKLGVTDQGNIGVIPGNVTPIKGDLAVTFNGSDPADGSFSATLHFAATFEDVNTLP
jgi:hypothetical protein